MAPVINPEDLLELAQMQIELYRAEEAVSQAEENLEVAELQLTNATARRDQVVEDSFERIQRIIELPETLDWQVVNSEMERIKTARDAVGTAWENKNRASDNHQEAVKTAGLIRYRIDTKINQSICNLTHAILQSAKDRYDRAMTLVIEANDNYHHTRERAFNALESIWRDNPAPDEVDQEAINQAQELVRQTGSNRERTEGLLSQIKPDLEAAEAEHTQARREVLAKVELAAQEISTQVELAGI